MAAYTRQSAASIVTGAVIQASHFNNEFNSLESAFNGTTGHDHTGGTGLGPLIALSGGSSGITGTLGVANGGTGATTLTDGGILLGSGTGAITPMGVLANGSIIVGDGTTDPISLAAFTGSAGTLKHESGGLELDISAVTTDNFIVGDSSGVVALKTPAQVKTILNLGVDRSFEANNSTTQSIPASTWTKVEFQDETYDTQNEYNNSTYLYLPTTAKKYMIIASVGIAAIDDGANTRIAIYEDGVELRQGTRVITGAAGGVQLYVGTVVNSTGSEYYEVFIFHSSSSAKNTFGTIKTVWFQGYAVN